MCKEFSSIHYILEYSNNHLRELEELGYSTPGEILEDLSSKVKGCYDWPSGKEYVGKHRGEKK